MPWTVGRIRWPVSATIAEGTFRETDLNANGFLFGGTVDVSYGGIALIMTYGAQDYTPDGVILLPAGLELGGDLTYNMTLSPTTDITGGGFMRVQVVDINTNVGLTGGPFHFLAGTTPGVTVFSGSVVFGGGAYPYTMPSDHRLNIVVGGISGPKGVVDTHWEVEVVV